MYCVDWASSTSYQELTSASRCVDGGVPHGRACALIEAWLALGGKQDIEVRGINDVEDGVKIWRPVMLIHETSLQLGPCRQSGRPQYWHLHIKHGICFQIQKFFNN